MLQHIVIRLVSALGTLLLVGAVLTGCSRGEDTGPPPPATTSTTADAKQSRCDIERQKNIQGFVETIISYNQLAGLRRIDAFVSGRITHYEEDLKLIDINLDTISPSATEWTWSDRIKPIGGLVSFLASSGARREADVSSTQLEVTSRPNEVIEVLRLCARLN
jgi:hypothetical protein